MTTIGVFCDAKEGDIGDSCRLTERGCTTGLLRGCKIGCCPRGRLGGVGSRRSSGRATPDIGGRKLLDPGSMVNVFIDAWRELLRIRLPRENKSGLESDSGGGGISGSRIIASQKELRMKWREYGIPLPLILGAACKGVKRVPIDAEAGLWGLLRLCSGGESGLVKPDVILPCDVAGLSGRTKYFANKRVKQEIFKDLPDTGFPLFTTGISSKTSILGSISRIRDLAVFKISSSLANFSTQGFPSRDTLTKFEHRHKYSICSSSLI